MEANNGSTLHALQKLNEEVMDTYKFATLTFEHDIYQTNHVNTRLESRRILENRGYIRVFSDVNNKGRNPFEDWYVHPDLVDMTFVQEVIAKNEHNYKPNVPAVASFMESPVQQSINWQDIEY